MTVLPAHSLRNVLYVHFHSNRPPLFALGLAPLTLNHRQFNEVSTSPRPQEHVRDIFIATFSRHSSTLHDMFKPKEQSRNWSISGLLAQIIGTKPSKEKAKRKGMVVPAVTLKLTYSNDEMNREPDLTVLFNKTAKEPGERRRAQTANNVLFQKPSIQRSASGQLVMASRLLEPEDLNTVPAGRVPIALQPPDAENDRRGHRRARTGGFGSTPQLSPSPNESGEVRSIGNISVEELPLAARRGSKSGGGGALPVFDFTIRRSSKDANAAVVVQQQQVQSPSSSESTINSNSTSSSSVLQNSDGRNEFVPRPLQSKRAYGSSTSLSGTKGKHSISEQGNGLFHTSLEPNAAGSIRSLGSGMDRHSVERYGTSLFVTAVSDQKPLVYDSKADGVDTGAGAGQRRRSMSSTEVPVSRWALPSLFSSNFGGSVGEGSRRRTRALSVDYTLRGSGNPLSPMDDKLYVSVKETSSVVSVRSSLENCGLMSDEPDSSQGQVNQYTILRTIDEGGFGKVVLCRNCDNGRYYACKVISKQRMRKKWRWAEPNGGGSLGGGNERRRIPPPRSPRGQRRSSQASVGGSILTSNNSLSLPSPSIDGTSAVSEGSMNSYFLSPSPSAQTELSQSMSTVSSFAAAATRNSASSDTDFLSTIKREVAILKKLSHHPHITPLVEVLDDAREDNFFMVFELCEYGAVMNVKSGEVVAPFTEERARKYFRDIILGLEYLHNQCIIHRDLKPANIMLTADDTAQIGDFGISHIFDEGQDDDTLECVKTASPLFCPPEACGGVKTRKVKGRPMDIWSLGVTLYCFVHGQCPFQDNNILELFRKIVEDVIPYSPSLSPSLRDLLERMMDRDAEQRIKLDDIRNHYWVTKDGAENLISKEENCTQIVPVTEEEVRKAVRPAMSFISKIFSRLGSTPKNKNTRQIGTSVVRTSSPDSSPTVSNTGLAASTGGQFFRQQSPPREHDRRRRSSASSLHGSTKSGTRVPVPQPYPYATPMPEVPFERGRSKSIDLGQRTEIGGGQQSSKVSPARFPKRKTSDASRVSTSPITSIVAERVKGRMPHAAFEEHNEPSTVVMSTILSTPPISSTNDVSEPTEGSGSSPEAGSTLSCSLGVQEFMHSIAEDREASRESLFAENA